ncbi:hypothetical protein diail_12046, partial [Diaporthe ilicicola]
LTWVEWRVADISPNLSTGLTTAGASHRVHDRLCLAFGCEDVSTAYRILTFLRSSLVSSHLIDYWAVSVDEEMVDRGRGEWLRYYPVFPSGLGPSGEDV